METVIKALVGLKLVGLVLFAIGLVISIAYTLAVGPDDPETKHGYTAVCKDGTVHAPPWNSCKDHGYLDHWTTGPAAPTAEPRAEDSGVPNNLPADVVNDGLGSMPTPSACTDADARGVVPRDRWTPCGQILGYFDDWATPPPGAPVVP
ncbi:hypothetical protein ACIP4X_14015 [Streptomyces sp. NPDC088817]|uniref:hypothetical protein n=1 Tax=Streptomyces sp. NPDC088817 TaxID=3365907 RepID=UPI0038267B93